MNSTTRVLQFQGSTAISKVTYNMDTWELEVRFPHTKKTATGNFRATTWMFQGVPPTEFADWCITDSPGRFFNDRIRTVYHSTRIHPPPEV